MSLTPEQQDFLLKAAQASVESERETGCPGEISLSQSIFESGWGKHMPGNNCFGIKIHGDWEAQYLPTTEWFNDAQCAAFLAKDNQRTAKLRELVQQNGDRKLYDCTDAFSAYPTMADCFSDHARLIQNGVYASAWQKYQQDRDLDSYIAGISAHYATAPGYSKQITDEAHSGTVQRALQAARQGGNVT